MKETKESREYTNTLLHKTAFHAHTAFGHGVECAKNDPHIRPESLAFDHWAYVRDVIREHGQPDEYLEFAGVYKRAFVAGFRSVIPEESSKDQDLEQSGENRKPLPTQWGDDSQIWGQ